jgi:K+-sensing histidine kinase KdpD
VERRSQVGGPETQTGQARLLDYMENAIILADIREKGPYFAAGNCSLDEVLQAAHQRAVKFAGFYKVKIGPLPRGLGTVVGDGFFLEKALFCLLRTAIIFSHANGEVRLQAPSLHAEACLTIEADGFSVPEDILPRFFEMLAFPQSDTPLDDLGLAPVVADRIISPLGGVVAVSRIHPAGTRFHIVLPRPSQASSAPAAADHDAA